MGLTWDSRKLGELRQRLGELADGTFRRAAVKVLAETAMSQLANEFRRGRDPYGQAWKPPKKRQGQPLLDTGRLRNSFSYRATEQGFAISSNVRYAAIHNFGGPVRVRGAGVRMVGKARVPISRGGKLGFFIMPKRQMLPYDGDLGPIWGQAFVRQMEDLVQARFRGVA